MFPVTGSNLGEKKYFGELIAGLTLIFTVYAVNFYLGFKLVIQYFSNTNFHNPKKITRIIFFCIEIAFLCFHSFLVWISCFEIQASLYFPLNFINIFKLATIITLYTSYFSSLLRTIFMWPFFKIVANKHFEIIDTIGETDPATRHNISS